MAGKTEYKNNWQKENLDRINLTMPKGKKDEVKAHAEAQEESVNGFINRAIDETMEHDKTGSPQQPKAAPRPAAPAPEDSVVYLSPEALETAKEAAKRKGETVAGFVARAIASQAGRDAGGEKARQAAEKAPAQIFPPDVEETAREAAGRTGENLAAFVRRAIGSQAASDKIGLHFGINPAAKDNPGKDTNREE